MTPIDDELRDVLRGRAENVVPATDPMAGIERRARAIQRRRRIAAVAGSALSVLVMVAVAPVAAPKLKSWRGDEPVTDAAMVESGAAGPLFAEQGTSAPARRAPSRPANHLDSSYPQLPAVPAALVGGGRTDLAAVLGVTPTRLVAEELWAGRIPDTGEWLYAVQGWPKGGTEATIAVYRATRAGARPVPVYRSPAPKPSLARDVDLPATLSATPAPTQVALVSIPVDAWWLLVLPAPGVSHVGYAGPDSRRFTRYPVDGRPVLVRRTAGPDALELVQAVDRAGRILTPPGATAQQRAKQRGGPVLSGWGLSGP